MAVKVWFTIFSLISNYTIVNIVCISLTASASEEIFLGKKIRGVISRLPKKGGGAATFSS